jgi:hypothetical protein
MMEPIHTFWRKDMVDAEFENNDPTSRPGTTNHWMELRIAGFF